MYVENLEMDNSLKLFFFYQRRRSNNSAMTVIAQDDHFTTGAWAACERARDF